MQFENCRFAFYYRAKCFQLPKNENRLTINVMCVRKTIIIIFDLKWQCGKNDKKQKTNGKISVSRVPFIIRRANDRQLCIEF